MGAREPAAHLAVGLDVGALQRPVPRDVGVDEPTHAPRLHVERQVDRVDAGARLPALRHHLALARVDAHHDAARPEPPDGLAHEVRVADGRGAQHDAVDAQVEHRLDVVEGPDAAADLDGDVQRRRDASDHVPVVGDLVGRRPRRVEVHEVDHLGVHHPPQLRHADGVVEVDRFVLVAPLPKADAAAVAEVDGGDDEHGASKR